MRITHIIIGLNIGGAELMLKRLVLQGQKDKSVHHSIISLTDLGVIGIQLREKGIPIYYIGIKSRFLDFNKIFKLRKILKETQPDVVQTWMYHADLIGTLSAKSLGINNIVWGIRTTDVSQGASNLTSYICKVCAKLSHIFPKAIICAAEKSKEHHVSIGYDEKKMIVIPNGYQIEELLAPKERGLEIRKEFNLSSSDIVIGSIGRFNIVKNQKFFIEISAELVKEMPELKFMLIGRDNTDNNEHLMHWINKYDLSNNFILLGERKDIPSCLQAMDIFCLHSKTEGFPNVLVEALAAGVPCVANNVGDVEYILRDYGYCIPRNNKKEFCNKIKEIINEVLPNTKKLNNLQQLSGKYVNENFSIEQIYESYKKVWLS